MAWPESLTTDQQTAIIALANFERSWAAGLLHQNDVGTQIGAMYFGGLSALLAGLNAADIVPNTGSSYAGAQPLTVQDVINLALWANTLANPANSDQGTGSYASAGIIQACVKAAGINT